MSLCLCSQLPDQRTQFLPLQRHPPPSREVRELVNVHGPDRRPAAWAVGSASGCLFTVHFGSKPVKGGVLCSCCCLAEVLCGASNRPLSALLSPELVSLSHKGPGQWLHGYFCSATPTLTCLCLASCHSGLSVCPDPAQCCQGPGHS